jgi:hypothetical protein
MRGFLRYLCYYCLSRAIYNTRNMARQPAITPQPCAKHGAGILLTTILAAVCCGCQCYDVGQSG